MIHPLFSILYFTLIIMILKVPYVLALCDVFQQHGVPLGVATRIGGQKSLFNCKAPKLIQSIVRYSPASEAVAIEILHEFHKVPRLKNLGSIPLLYECSPLADRVPVALALNSQADTDTEAEAGAGVEAPDHYHQWAQSVVMALEGLTECQISMELKPVLNLTSEYLDHLIIAGLSSFYEYDLPLIVSCNTTVCNPDGKKTPQTSLCPSPNVVRTLAHIRELIGESKWNQGALKKLVHHRCSVEDFH
jgi:hypothetical protein